MSREPSATTTPARDGDYLGEFGGQVAPVRLVTLRDVSKAQMDWAMLATEPAPSRATPDELVWLREPERLAWQSRQRLKRRLVLWAGLLAYSGLLAWAVRS